MAKNIFFKKKNCDGVLCKAAESFIDKPGGGGTLGISGVGMCHWDPGTLNLYQS